MSIKSHYIPAHSFYTHDDYPGEEFIVEQDTDAEDPRQWGNGEVIVYRAACRYSTDDTAVTPAIRVFLDRYAEFGDADHALTIANRWAAVFTPGTVLALGGARGYSQGDWIEYVYVTDACAPTDEFNAWFAGDVWLVSCEDDRLSGIYADTAEDALEYYLEEYR